MLNIHQYSSLPAFSEYYNVPAFQFRWRKPRRKEPIWNRTSLKKFKIMSKNTNISSSSTLIISVTANWRMSGWNGGTVGRCIRTCDHCRYDPVHQRDVRWSWHLEFSDSYSVRTKWWLTLWADPKRMKFSQTCTSSPRKSRVSVDYCSRIRKRKT